MVAPYSHESLREKSLYDINTILDQYLEDAEEGDIYIVHMINRSILENDRPKLVGD